MKFFAAFLISISMIVKDNHKFHIIQIKPKNLFSIIEYIESRWWYNFGNIGTNFCTSSTTFVGHKYWISKWCQTNWKWMQSSRFGVVQCNRWRWKYCSKYRYWNWWSYGKSAKNFISNVKQCQQKCSWVMRLMQWLLVNHHHMKNEYFEIIIWWLINFCLIWISMISDFCSCFMNYIE